MVKAYKTNRMQGANPCSKHTVILHSVGSNMKHDFIDALHCTRCWDIGVKRMSEIGKEPSPVLVSPEQYKNIKKYGYPERIILLGEEKLIE